VLLEALTEGLKKGEGALSPKSFVVCPPLMMGGTLLGGTFFKKDGDPKNLPGDLCGPPH